MDDRIIDAQKYSIEEDTINEKGIRDITASPNNVGPIECPACGGLAIRKGKVRSKGVLDMYRYEPIIIHTHLQKYRCQNCGRIFKEPCELYPEKVRITNEFRESFIKEVFATPDLSFNQAAKKYGLCSGQAFL